MDQEKLGGDPDSLINKFISTDINSEDKPENQAGNQTDSDCYSIISDFMSYDFETTEDENGTCEIQALNPQFQEFSPVNSNNNPFVFFAIDEIKNITINNLPKTQMVKTCGYFYDIAQKLYLYHHPNAEKTKVLDGIEVDTESISAFPSGRKLYESFGGLKRIDKEEDDPKVMFTIWFYRERIGSYNDLVEFGKMMRERFCQNFI